VSPDSLISDYQRQWTLMAQSRFGHYLTVTHGHDDWGNGDFRDIERIWKRIYPEKPYPNEPLLATYHGEFGVSRARIRNNPRATYEELRKVLQAPAADPIYQEEGHWGCKGVPDGYVSWHDKTGERRLTPVLQP